MDPNKKIWTAVWALALFGSIWAGGCMRNLNPLTPAFIPPATTTPSLPVTSTPPPAGAYTPTATVPVTWTVVATASIPVSLTFTATPTRTPTATMTEAVSLTPSATVPVTWTATPSPSPSLTASPSTTPGGWDVTGSPVTLLPGTYNYSYIHLYPGAGIFLYGPVTFAVTDYFTMDAGSSIIGNGYSRYETSGTPPNTSSSAGAGHGGAGGADGLGSLGGAAYDSPTMPSLSGSMGAYRNCSGYGAPGGALVVIQAAGGSATLNGEIRTDGMASFNCGGAPDGAGSGGAVFIQADMLQGAGRLLADGGSGTADTSGGGDNAGGGGGGIIVLSTHMVDNFTGTTSVLGGQAVAPAQPGSNGIFNTTTY